MANPKDQAEIQADAASMARFRQAASGTDPYGRILTDSAHQEAVRQYEWLKGQRTSHELEERRLVLLAELQHAQIAETQQRLLLEAERVQIEKAQVVVRLLEVAAQGGVSGELLLGMVQDFGAKILSDSMVPATLALTDRKNS